MPVYVITATQAQTQARPTYGARDRHGAGERTGKGHREAFGLYLQPWV